MDYVAIARIVAYVSAAILVVMYAPDAFKFVGRLFSKDEVVAVKRIVLSDDPEVPMEKAFIDQATEMLKESAKVFTNEDSALNGGAFKAMGINPGDLSDEEMDDIASILATASEGIYDIGKKRVENLRNAVKELSEAVDEYEKALEDYHDLKTK